MNVLMVGVDRNRVGGMWTVAETFINNEWFNQKVNLYYVATATGGSKIKRIGKMLEGYCKAIKIFASKKIDIVHIHMAEKGSVYRKGIVIILAKLFGAKVIVQMHAGPILAWYESLPKRKQVTVAKIFNSADQMLVLGEYWKKQMATIVAVDKIEVLYNGVECPEENPYNADGKYILYMGLLKKTKGTYDLIDAIKLIDSELSQEIKVYLCGVDENGETEKLCGKADAEYVTEHGLQNRIVMPGWIDKNTRLALFKNTQICVLPSYYEALSMTALESMAYGIPLVTTDISTMPELLGSQIKLVNPGDINGLAKEILSLEKDKMKRCQYSEIEYDRAKNIFKKELIFDRVIGFYEKLIDEVAI